MVIVMLPVYVAVITDVFEAVAVCVEVLEYVGVKVCVFTGEFVRVDVGVPVLVAVGVCVPVLDAVYVVLGTRDAVPVTVNVGLAAEPSSLILSTMTPYARFQLDMKVITENDVVVVSSISTIGMLAVLHVPSMAPPAT